MANIWREKKTKIRKEKRKQNKLFCKRNVNENGLCMFDTTAYILKLIKTTD